MINKISGYSNRGLFLLQLFLHVLVIAISLFVPADDVIWMIRSNEYLEWIFSHVHHISNLIFCCADRLRFGFVAESLCWVLTPLFLLNGILAAQLIPVEKKLELRKQYSFFNTLGVAIIIFFLVIFHANFGWFDKSFYVNDGALIFVKSFTYTFLIGYSVYAVGFLLGKFTYLFLKGEL